MPKSQVTVRLDKKQLARAQKALGAETITETIERALALATEKATHDAILRKYSGVGKKDSFAAG
jgi:Arc/MetJ family transcription regulator